MRLPLAALALVSSFMLGACGGDDSGKTDLAGDMTASTGDLVSTEFHCAELLACTGACNMDGTCTNTCVSKASANAKALFNQTYLCAIDGCLPSDMSAPYDLGPGSCQSLSDSSAECEACVTHFGETDPTCGALYAQCLADK
jgi:hypothetical protein